MKPSVEKPCATCDYLEGSGCRAHRMAQETLGRGLPPPPLGACMIPIVEGYLQRIESGTTVLDIGCGTWERIRDHCESVGAEYEAIDVQAEYFGKPAVATRLENLSRLSFESERFDVVIANQSMEHWAEYGCSLRQGLFQAFRVCKPGGWVLLNVPIHFHGTAPFLMGRLERIVEALEPFSGEVSFERWGMPGDPLPPCFPHPGYGALRSKPAYVLNIEARKDWTVDRVRPGRTLDGRLAQLVEYPLSFNLYRIRRRLGIKPRRS